jgi:hypothetical protein
MISHFYDHDEHDVPIQHKITSDDRRQVIFKLFSLPTYIGQLEHP